MYPTVKENLSFEVAKTLAQVNLSPSHPAMTITWGQITEVITETLIDFNLPPRPDTARRNCPARRERELLPPPRTNHLLERHRPPLLRGIPHGGGHAQRPQLSPIRSAYPGG